MIGYTMRTDRYRCTEWRNHLTGELLVRELYDYAADPQGNANIADEPDNAELVERFAAQLAAGWRGALPRETVEQRNTEKSGPGSP